jgi:hypothetical protein
MVASSTAGSATQLAASSVQAAPHVRRHGRLRRQPGQGDQ